MEGPGDFLKDLCRTSKSIDVVKKSHKRIKQDQKRKYSATSMSSYDKAEDAITIMNKSEDLATTEKPLVTVTVAATSNTSISIEKESPSSPQIPQVPQVPQIHKSDNNNNKYIGKRVAKLFDDEQGEPLGLFRGIVMRCVDSDSESLLVTYDDGDSENVKRLELKEMIKLFAEVGEEMKYESKKAYRHEVFRRAKDYYFQIMVDHNPSDALDLKSKYWNIKVRTNVYCHICQAVKPFGGIFPCNISYHSYCQHHLKTRLGVDLSSETIKPIQYCPICCITCTCSLCSHRLDHSARALEQCNLKKRPFAIKEWVHVQSDDYDVPNFKRKLTHNTHPDIIQDKITEIPNNQLNLLSDVIDLATKPHILAQTLDSIPKEHNQTPNNNSNLTSSIVTSSITTNTTTKTTKKSKSKSNNPPKVKKSKPTDNSLVIKIKNCLNKQYNTLYQGNEISWKYDARCHLCHARRDKVLSFHCNLHFYCLKHLESRFNISREDISNNKVPCCPLCTLYCDCAKCLRNYTNLVDYAHKNRPLLSTDYNWLPDLLIKSSLYPRTLKEQPEPVKIKVHQKMNEQEVSKAMRICLETQYFKVNNGQHSIAQNAYCHLCQLTMNGIFFSCGKHSYCSKHIEQCYNIKEPDIPSQISSICCPVCTLACTCIECTTKFTNLLHLVQKKKPLKNATNKWFHNVLKQSKDYPFNQIASALPTADAQSMQAQSKQNQPVNITNKSNPMLLKYDDKCKQFEHDFFFHLSNIPSIAILASFVCLGVEVKRGRQFYKFMRFAINSCESIFIFVLCFYGVFSKLEGDDFSFDDYFRIFDICLCVQNDAISDYGQIVNGFYVNVKTAMSNSFVIDHPPTPEHLLQLTNRYVSIISYYEHRFFDDLANYGTDSIVFLASSTTYADGSHMRRYYALLKDQKTDTKYNIINQCLCTVLLRWIKYHEQCMDFDTFWEICLILSSCFMSYGIQYSILRDFCTNTPGSFGILVQQAYQRYHDEGFIQPTHCTYSIFEYNKHQQNNLKLNEQFIKRHEHQIEQTFTSAKEDVDEIALLRRKNNELSSKVTTLESEVSELKASNSSLRAQLSMDHASEI